MGHRSEMISPLRNLEMHFVLEMHSVLEMRFARERLCTLYAFAPVGRGNVILSGGQSPQSNPQGDAKRRDLSRRVRLAHCTHLHPVGRGFYSRRVRQALCTVLCLV